MSYISIIFGGMEKKKHSCEAEDGLIAGQYGCAVTWCQENEDGRFYVGNDEYSNDVPFCPFCGAESPHHFEKQIS